MSLRLPYLLGLDLGQTQDPTALVALQLQRIADPLYVAPDPLPEGRRATPRQARDFLLGPPQVLAYLCRLIHRWPLGTAYTRIVQDVCDLVEQQPLRGATLVVDQTGVGRAVVDQFREKRPLARLKAVTITAGHTASLVGSDYHVPKKDLVAVLQVVLQQRRWKTSGKLSEAETLTKELNNFQVKVTQAANETFGNWREGENDDTVLASAVAIWYGERSASVVKRKPPKGMHGLKIPRIGPGGMTET